jgi:hypothetical protein
MKHGILNADHTISYTDDVASAYKKETKIRQEFVKDFFISTVFLPIDHGFGDGPSVHFETYVFPAKDRQVLNWVEVWGERSSSYEAALKAHKAVKGLILNGEMEASNG